METQVHVIAHTWMALVIGGGLMALVLTFLLPAIQSMEGKIGAIVFALLILVALVGGVRSFHQQAKIAIVDPLGQLSLPEPANSSSYREFDSRKYQFDGTKDFDVVVK